MDMSKQPAPPSYSTAAASASTSAAPARLTYADKFLLCKENARCLVLPEPEIGTFVVPETGRIVAAAVGENNRDVLAVLGQCATTEEALTELLYVLQIQVGQQLGARYQKYLLKLAER